MRHRALSWALAASLMTLPVAVRAAEPVSLKFASPAPPQSQVNGWGIAPWIEEVHKAAGDTLDIKLFPGPALGTFNNIYDRTINGVVEIAFGVLGPYAGQFERTEVSSLPFEGGTCLESSVALWRLVQQGIIAPEFQKVRPLALFVFPGSGIHTKKEIHAVEDLQGLKVAAFARVGATAADLLGATPVTMTPSDAYQSVQRGVATSIMVGWSAVVPFKYFEVTNWHLEAPLGQAPAFIFMNKETYARLPDKGKAAIDGLSYEGFSKRMGGATGRMDEMFRGMVKAMPGHTVYSLPTRQEEIWKQRLKPITDEWAKATPDGEKVLAAFRAEVDKVRRGM